MNDSTQNSSSQSSSPYSLRAYDVSDSTQLPTQISSKKTFQEPYSLRPYSTDSTEEEVSEKIPTVLELVEFWEPEDNITSSAAPTTTAQIERDNTILKPKKNSKEPAVSTSAKDLSLELTAKEAPNTSVLSSEQTIPKPIDTVKRENLDNQQIAEVEITPVSQLEERQRAPVDITTPVSQLDDIQPSDWAFQALHSLSDRYGINKANPNGGFPGNRALTRYEFANALQTTIEQINELVAQGNTPVISRDDIAILERLQEEFAAELTRLQGRVDTLEVRTSQLQANQFSTTTKLTGQVIFGVTGGSFSGDRIVDVTGREITTKQPNPTFVYRAALDFNTSFSGSDLLKIRLDAGSDGADDNAAGFLEPSLGSVLDFAAKPPVEQFGISRLFYTFSPLRNVTLSLGPKIVLSDYIDTNRYANLSFLDFSTQAFVNNYLLFPVQGLGAGAVISWNPGDGPFTARAGYVAAAANEPTSRDSTSFVPGIFPIGYTLYPNGGSTGGLFGDPHQGIAELEYAPSKNFAFRFQYAFGNILGGEFNVFGANFELAFSDRFGVFGRYGHASYKDTTFGDINPSYWMLGLAFPDLFVRGAKAGIAVGQPFMSRDVGNATQTNFEAFYNYPISNNIQITPVVQVITNPGNQESNGTVFTGTLRTVFSF
ncbi:iron uptake porin [Scytonema sp. UIC 10036]|nr:iron uptake porin [Scytonema sp. UIC 10036]